MSLSKSDYDVLNKVLLIGDSRCGKTALLAQICGEGFFEDHIPTIGVDFRILHRTFGQVKAKLQIWDTAGEERWRYMMNKTYQGAHGILIVYDVGDRGSFDNVQRWIKDTDAANCKARFIVANKAELPTPAVSLEEGEQLAKALGVGFLSCSARTGQGLEELLETLFEGMQPKPGVVLTVTASRGNSGRLRLSCLRVSGAEAGSVEIDEVDQPCCSVLPELRRACGLKATEPAHFLTVAGAQLPQMPYVHLPKIEEVCFELSKEQLHDEEWFSRHVEATLSERGLYVDDITGDETCISHRGKELLPGEDAQNWLHALVDADYPVCCRMSVKRRQNLSIDAVFPLA